MNNGPTQPIVMTLVLVREGGRVLLGMKKTKIGAGRWNGYGGKVEEGENVEDAARRELTEESGLTAGVLRHAAVCTFISPVRPPIEMHIFDTEDVTGMLKESEEIADPQWFDIGDLPTADMWKSDLLWWPHYVAGKKFTARFVFDKDDNVLEHEIVLVE